MRFHLIDGITEVVPGRSLVAVKRLTLAEEYLADHFPGFPVMPGVLMLHSLVEAASWLVRLSTDYRHSVLALREVRGVKYGNFMVPGHAMRIEVEWAKEQEGGLISFKGKGESGGQQTANAQFTLHGYNLADRDPALADRDRRVVEALKRQAELLLRRPTPAATPGSGQP